MTRVPAPLRLAILWMILAPKGVLGAEVPTLHAGAIELGIVGALVSVEGSTSAAVALRANRFIAAPSGLAGIEAEVGYNHLQGLDMVELEGNVSWQHAMGAGSTYPYASVGGGLREETIGSFSTARYPVGFSLGVRTLFGARAALRIEYRFRRVLNDPVADFNEHQARTGISLLLNNAAHADPTHTKEP